MSALADYLPSATLTAAGLACALAVGGIHYWQRGKRQNWELEERLSSHAGYQQGAKREAFSGLDRWVRGTRFGQELERRIAATGLRVTPGQFTFAVIAWFFVAWFLAQLVLAPFFGPIAALIALWSSFAFLNWRRQIRIERFIGQLPELARVLANATQAGLALRTAVAMAAEELDAPAGEELAKVSSALAVGHSLEDALRELQERLPSRELAVLVSTLILASRAGGSLVASLRNLTQTLEERKETRREVRTQMSQVTVTAYAVPVMGLGSLLLLDQIMPGALAAMTASTPGRIAVIVALGLYIVGFAMIRRMSKIDV